MSGDCDLKRTRPSLRYRRAPQALGEIATMITLTEKAASKVKEIRDTENLGEQGLRLRVIGGGCSGFQYDLFFEDEVNDTT
jgi:hypothetical protein